MGLSGSVNVHNHYFESGNIQFNLKKEFPEVPVEMSAQAIVNHISKKEEEVSTFSLSVLKQSRRHVRRHFHETLEGNEEGDTNHEAEVRLDETNSDVMMLNIQL